MRNQHWAIVIFFFILVVLLRFSSFFQSILSWDESLYLLVAEKLLDGYPLYKEIWDNKPPGIYFVFLLALILLGHSVYGKGIPLEIMIKLAKRISADS
jgi:hypothetical protein